MFGFFRKKKTEKKEDIYIENEMGKFLVTTYGKTTPMLTGVIDWPDSYNAVEANVICDTDNDHVQSENLIYLSRILADSTKLDEDLKIYITENQIDEDGLVHIWGDCDLETEPDPITPEDFKSKLHLSYIRIYQDATSEFVFPADGLYTDHDLVVRVDHELNLTECVLEG